MTQPTWTNERRKLSDLIPWERNPRKIEDKQAKRLIESFDDFGQVETIALSPDNEIYNGHQRASVLAGQHGMDYEVDVRVASRPLTEQERKKLTIFLHHSAAGEWDLAALADWDTNDLLSWDFDLSAFDVDVAQSTDEDWTGAMGKLPDEDRQPFQQMTFTLHDLQVEQVKRALGVASSLGGLGDSLNENGNGNALAFICETYITEHGNR